MRVLIFCLFLVSFFSCKETKPIEPKYVEIRGETMGTYYRIKYGGVAGISKSRLQEKVDSILFFINDEMSTYIDTSFISEFNKASSKIGQVPFHFANVFKSAKDVFASSNGSFDPTVMPLTNYWGFGYSGKVANLNWDSTALKQLVDIVGFDKVSLTNDILTKQDPDIQLDFSALAKGYAADVIGLEMKDLGIENLLVDIGGDGYAQGRSKSGKHWRFGINIPDPNAAYTDVFVALELDKKGLATSGNYRNYYEVDGELYGHTINTKTGFPFKSNVLSASVIANTAMEADALATACMASYLEDGISLIERLPGAEAYLIYEDEVGKMKEKYTTGFKDYILE